MKKRMRIIVFSSQLALFIILFSFLPSAYGITTLVSDLNPGGGSSNPSSPIIYNGEMYFSAYNGTTGWLWKYNGTTIT